MNERAEYEIRLKDAFTPGLKKAAGEMDAFESKLGNLQSMALKVGIGLSLASVGVGIKKLSDLGAAAEQTRISFEVLTGSKKAGNSLLSELKEYANITPYVSKDILDASKVMLGFGIAQDKIMPTMRMLGDVASGDAERLGGLALVYGQVNAAGRLMGQDLLQLINRGFNPLKIMSEKTGLSMAELKKKMEDGAISANDVANAFKIATSEGGLFFQMTDKQSQTFGGRMSTLSDKLEMYFTKVGENINKTWGPLLDKVTWVIDHTTNPTGSKVADIQSTAKDIYMGKYLMQSWDSEEGRKKFLESFPQFGTGTVDSNGNPLRIDKNRARSFFDQSINVNSSDLQKQKDKLLFERAGLNMSGKTYFGTNQSASEMREAQKAFRDYTDQIKEIDKAIEDISPKGIAKGILELYNLRFGNVKKGSGVDGFDFQNNPIAKGSGGGSSGGSSDARLGGTKNVTINVAKLVESVNIKYSDLKDNSNDMTEAVKRALLTALNDANIAVN
jgi:tape measure domain-containing protein